MMNLALWLWQIQQGNHLGVFVCHANLSLSQWVDHQGNGAAEVTVQVIRQLNMCFLQRLEAGRGLDKPVFEAHYPLTAWWFILAGQQICNNFWTDSS